MHLYFPPEVLEIIFEQVQILNEFTSGVDLLHASRACYQFRKILEPTKSVWLFKEILPHMVRAIALDLKSLLTLRKVCKEWRRTVDHYLENQDFYLSKISFCCHHFTRNRSINFDPFVHPLKVTRIRTHLSTVDFLNLMLNESSKNPLFVNLFPCGRLSLSTVEGEDKQTFYELLTVLLYNVRVIHLEVNNSAYPAEHFKVCLIHHLSVLPNLQTLSLTFENLLLEPEPWLTSNNVLILPELPNLQKLQIKCESYDPLQDEIFSEYFNSLCLDFKPVYPQLKELAFVGFSHYGYTWLNHGVAPMQLTKLQLQLSSERRLYDLLYLLTRCKHLTKFTLFCVGKERHWPTARKSFLEKLFPFLTPSYIYLEKLRIFWTLPKPILIGNIEKESCNTLALLLLQEMEWLRCLHLKGFSFVGQSLIEYLPSSLECLVLECFWAAGDVVSTNRFCFRSDTQKSRTEITHYRIKKQCPRIKCIGLQKLSERAVHERRFPREEVQLTYDDGPQGHNDTVLNIKIVLCCNVLVFCFCILVIFFYSMKH